MSNVASERVVNGIKTRVLHGKDYVEVQERVRIAHGSEHQFEQAETVHFSIGDRWFVRCVIKVDGKQFIGTAEIKFLAPKNTPDGTNPFECAETSALGRALAFAGLGTVESIASFDEVYRVNAIEQAEMGGRPVVEAASQPAQLPAPQENRHSDIPTIRELQARCNKLFGIGHWQAMIQKVLKVPEDALIRESDLTPEDRLNVKKYMDYVESTKQASAGAGR